MSGELEYVNKKIDEASQGFATSANLFKEAHKHNKGVDMLVEARGIFWKIRALTSVLKANHTEALEALNSGITHTQTAFDTMQETGDFTLPGDEASMMTYTQECSGRQTRQSKQQKLPFQGMIIRYPNLSGMTIYDF